MVRLHVHFLVLAAGKPQEAQVCFWMCRDRRPVVDEMTVSPLSSRPPCNCSCPIYGSLLFQLLCRTSGGYISLTTATAQSVRLVVTLSERAGSLRCLNLSVSLSSEWIEIVGQDGRTHFVGLSGAIRVSMKWYRINKSQYESDGVLTYHC